MPREKEKRILYMILCNQAKPNDAHYVVQAAATAMLYVERVLGNQLCTNDKQRKRGNENLRDMLFEHIFSRFQLSSRVVAFSR